jgi:hypothetical protein
MNHDCDMWSDIFTLFASLQRDCNILAEQIIHEYFNATHTTLQVRICDHTQYTDVLHRKQGDLLQYGIQFSLLIRDTQLHTTIHTTRRTSFKEKHVIKNSNKFWTHIKMWRDLFLYADMF